MSFEEISFPHPRGDELVQTHPIDIGRPTILTVMAQTPIKVHYITPNYLALPGNIYIFVLFSMIILAFTNLLGARLMTKRRHSFWVYTKNMLSNLSGLCLAHIGAIAEDPLHWTIRLLLLLSVTPILAFYNASFSIENMHILLPRYYKTYESILEDPPKLFQIISPLSERFEQSNKPIETQIFKLHIKASHLSNIKIDVNYVALTQYPHYDCLMIKANKDWIVAGSVDPDSAEYITQYRISPSIWKKIQGQQVLKRLRRLVEMSMTKARERKIIIDLLNLPRTRKYSTYRIHLNGSKPCIDKIQPDLNNYRDVNAGSTWPVFAWWFYLLIFSCIVISGEFITNRLHQIYQNKSNRVVPLTTQVRPVISESLLSAVSIGTVVCPVPRHRVPRSAQTHSLTLSHRVSPFIPTQAHAEQ